MTAPTTSEVRMLTVLEAAGRLSISRASVYKLLAKGDLESVRIGKSRRIPSDALDEYMQSLRD